MGVHGLSAFITDERPKLIRKLDLHSTRLVIDANNLTHYLYYNFHLNVLYGGDYDQFYKHLRAFFITLKQCRIQPVMVFDGAYNDDNRKFQTTLNRFKNRLESVRIVTRGARAGVLPILARQVFVSVLNDLDIQCITCDFEADDVLANIANYYDCPVLSNDSDFYIYNINAGFIPLDFLDITKHSRDGVEFIKVRIYKQEWLLHEFQCREARMAALLAVVIGNDFVGNDKFVDFYSMLNLPSRRVKFLQGKKNIITVSRSKERIYRILQWLQNAESFQSALDKLVQASKTSGFSDTEEIIMKNVNMYSVLDTGIVDYIKQGEVTPDNSQLYGRVPLRFLQSFRRCQVEPDLFNIMLIKRVMLLPQVEHLNSSSSYECSRALRRIIYGFMSEDSVVEYDRDIRNVIKHEVEPCIQLDRVKVPRILETNDMNDTELRDLLFSSLDSSFESLTVDEDLRLFSVVVAYWVRNAEPRPTMNLVRALLLSTIRIKIIEPLRGSRQQGLETHSDGQNLELTTEQLQTVVQKIGKIKTQGGYESDTSLPILHSMAQFQTCYLAASQLCQLLNQTPLLLKPGQFFNGLLIHNLTLELSKRNQPSAFVEDILGGSDSKLNEFYLSLWQQIVGLCGDCPPTEVSKKNKKKKKKRGTKSKAAEDVTSSSGDEDSDNVSGVEAACDLSNRFGVLSVCDE